MCMLKIILLCIFYRYIRYIYIYYIRYISYYISYYIYNINILIIYFLIYIYIYILCFKQFRGDPHRLSHLLKDDSPMVFLASPMVFVVVDG